MGKKVKIGKQRKDKYYQLAKEAGYRSRAAFKLIQLNKRFEFLQKSRAVVDLCAAPGGWLQVAVQNMPVSSICVGVDLVPIKPINKCITLQGDIKSDKTKQMITKELQGWEADCVLHDGAPNVGSNWIHDAFAQNCLTLSALRIATQILSKNGYFVTKLFRSNDFQSLIDVFHKLFKQVHIWKPAASRLESAEIFVVCEKYLKPEKVDQSFLNAKMVFKEPSTEKAKINPHAVLNPKKQKKQKAEGYEGSQLALHKSITATEFINRKDCLEVLSSVNSITLDNERIEQDKLTTEEIKHCIQDLKVCGPRELRLILAWRRNLTKKIVKEEKLLEDESKEASNDLEEKIDEPSFVENEDSLLQAEEKAALKKKRRKLLKEKAKLAKRKQLKMVHDNDGGEIYGEEELFSLAKVAKLKRNVIASKAQEVEMIESEKEESDAEIDDENNLELPDVDLMRDEYSFMTEEERNKARVSDWFSKLDTDDVDVDEEQTISLIERIMKNRDKNVKNEKTVSFDKNEENENEDLETTAMVEKSFLNSESDSDDESDDDVRIAKRNENRKRKTSESADETSVKRRKLTPEMLALGEQLIYSSKTRRDLEDWAWNRYTNNDENLPDWFVEDEEKHYRKTLPITKEQVKRYKERLREINARPIKKIAEAKARKRKRKISKMERAKKKAENVLENENLEQGEKMREVKKLYRKAAKSDKKEVAYKVMTKGKRGRASRPSGPYKVVDARLKKDNRKEKQSARAQNWKKMSTSAKRAQREKGKKQRRFNKSQRSVNRRIRRGKPV